MNITDPKFEQYMRLLLEWNEKINLTAIIQRDEIYSKHFEDSLTCLETGCITPGARVIDVGTGAGFPGIPLKLVRGDIDLTLMDSLNKRVSFLKEATAQLGIAAHCVHMRAEEAGRSVAHREQYDVAVSRAVAALPKLAEYCLPMVKVGGYFLGMKGKEIDAELAQAAPLVEAMGGKIQEVQLYTLQGTDITHSIVIVHKTAPTPARFPRSGKKIGML